MGYFIPNEDNTLNTHFEKLERYIKRIQIMLFNELKEAGEYHDLKGRKTRIAFDKIDKELEAMNYLILRAPKLTTLYLAAACNQFHKQELDGICVTIYLCENPRLDRIAIAELKIKEDGTIYE